MNVTLTVKHLENNKDIQELFDARVDKLMVHLSSFNKDSVFIHGNLERNPHKEEYYASVNVNVPSMTLHSKESAPDLFTALNFSFNSVIRQAEKLKSKIRRGYKRK